MRIISGSNSSQPPGGPPLFGDLLALARQSWVRQMAGRLAGLGYDDYRRSDPAVFRRLLRGPAGVGQLGAALRVTRQAARKVVEGLEQRQFATTERDARDGRRLNVVLTPAGEKYARAVVAVLNALNDELAQRVDPDGLAAARHVLRAVIDAAGGLQNGPSRNP